MPPSQEESSLREAIRTTLVQLCKVGVSYQNELSIEGTVGVTVDKQQVILVHFKETVENSRVVEVANTQPPATINQIQEPTRNIVTNTISTPVQNNVAHPNQMPLMSSPARIAQLLRDPMMGINISPRGNSGRTIRFDNVQNMPPPNQLVGAPSNPLSSDAGFSDLLLSESILGRLYPNELEAEGSKPGQQSSNAISIDIDSDESIGEETIGEETFEFIDKLGEMKTMKKEKVMKKMKKRSKKDAKSVIVIDDQSSEGGPDSVASLQTLSGAQPPPPPGPNPFTMENPSSLPTSTPLPMDDFPATDLLSSPTDTQPLPPGSSALEVAAVQSGLVDIKMSIANMGNNIVKGDISNLAAEPSTVIGHIIKTSTPEAISSPPQDLVPPRPSSRSKSMVNLQCESCGKALKSIGMLESHLVDFHGITQSSALGNITHVSCDKCKKKFKHQASLDKHKISHVTTKPHRCQQCDRSYRHRESLSIHATVHAGKLECQPCQKLYTSRMHFEKHISYMHETRRNAKGANSEMKTASPT